MSMTVAIIMMIISLAILMTGPLFIRHAVRRHVCATNSPASDTGTTWWHTYLSVCKRLRLNGSGILSAFNALIFALGFIIMVVYILSNESDADEIIHWAAYVGAIVMLAFIALRVAYVYGNARYECTMS